MKNEMEIIFDAISENEGFARVAVSAFVSILTRRWRSWQI